MTLTAGGTAVIVGANLAGGRAAETLRAEGFEGRIVLIGDEPFRPYERPPLSKEILRGEWDGDDKAFLREDTWYADNGIELMLGARADLLDIDGKRVRIGGDDVAFDALLLCTGGRPRRLKLPGADLDGVRTLRTFDDSHAIRDALRSGARLAVVGFGFIGAEVAASARALGAQVTILEMLELPLVRVLGPEIGARLGKLHEDNGVRALLSVNIERFEGATSVEQVVLVDGTTVEADLVVVGVGIEPNVELAREAGLAIDNGIVVDERCRTSAPGVYAAGDVAFHPNRYAGGPIRIEHWQNAQNQGAAAARAMLGAPEPFDEVPWFWSDQFGSTIQMAGMPGGYDRLVYRGDPASEKFAAFYMQGPRINAAFALNRGKEVRGARAVMEAGVELSDEVLADEDADLRKLARG